MVTRRKITKTKAKNSLPLHQRMACICGMTRINKETMIATTQPLCGNDYKIQQLMQFSISHERGRRKNVAGAVAKTTTYPR